MQVGAAPVNRRSTDLQALQEAVQPSDNPPPGTKRQSNGGVFTKRSDSHVLIGE